MKVTKTDGSEARARRNGHNGADVFHAADPIGDSADPNASPYPDRPRGWEERRKAEAVTEQRVKRWGAKRYPVAALGGVADQWARTVEANIERGDALRDPLKTAPTLMFEGDKAVKAGATDKQLQALAALSYGEITALRVQAAVLLDDQRTQVRERARALQAARAAAAVALPDWVDLANYTPSAEPFIVGGLLPAGKGMGVFAERKAGKTTAMTELVRSLLAGDEFLGRFATHLPADARVALLDTEMGTDMMRAEFGRGGVLPMIGRVDYADAMGRSQSLDMRDDANRARWVQRIAPGSFIIIDCLYAILQAANVDESSSEVAGFLEGFKMLAVETAAAGWAVVHHLGKDPDKGARGHSSIEGAVDTLVTIRLNGAVDDPDTERRLSAFGRMQVAVPPGVLTLGDDGRLTMSGYTPKADRQRAQDHKDDDVLWNLVNDHPGLSERGLNDLPAETRKLSRGRLRRALDRLSAVSYIVNHGTAERPAWHAANRDGDPFDAEGNAAQVAP